ncbi:MAG: L,D-transpeptidase family protein [Pseudomonadota bacterium]
MLAKIRFSLRGALRRSALPGAIAGALLAMPVAAQDGAALNLAFRQAVAEAAYGDESIAAFYRDWGYQPIFTGADEDDRVRRAALIEALTRAATHGLPAPQHDAAALTAVFAAADDTRARGDAEVAAARAFLAYAHAVQSGVLEPKRVDHEIVRTLPRRDGKDLLAGLAGPEPRAFLASLPPRTLEYNRLMAERMRLEEIRARGGWGPAVRAEKLEPGQRGEAVIALRNRLISKGYLPRTATVGYDRAVTAAVQTFQIDHGLTADGVAGPATLAHLNATVEERLGQVYVALERERWLNLPDGLGDRHIWVNLTDFHALVIDDGKVSFRTRSVVGDERDGKVTPEFSDTMEYMELNPTWTVPRGIIKRDYLPRLKANPNAASYLRLIDRRGRVVDRGAVNFANYTAANFPFNLVQPPGPRNALGTVKFMFPNPHAIYLHDTPEKHLFSRERRTYSSGCIRLNDPHEFAYHLLARQSEDPVNLFQSTLRTGQIKRINLEEPVPVHLVYRTVFGHAKGRMNYRTDIYGRDAKLWRALQAEGVRLGGAES